MSKTKPEMMRRLVAAALLLTIASTSAFSIPTSRQQRNLSPSLPSSSPSVLLSFRGDDDSTASSRRAFLVATTATSSILLIPSSSNYNANAAEIAEQKEETIAERAARVAREVDAAELARLTEEGVLSEQRRKDDISDKLKSDARSIYDFTLPINGKSREVAEILGQTFSAGRASVGWGDDGGESETVLAEGKEGTRIKAILVVNMKQDDPIARKNIPELIELSNKFGKNGEFAVIVSPTDQGYYEPDTSALLRLKLEQEYGYGSSPGTVLTDKVNLLGTGALPFWRWLEGSCRTPAGLGKIQANFEKFLVDGRTGKPLRRYPRKYQPYDMTEDIASLIAGKPLPPAGSNYKEEWRNAAKEAENDTYRFQKGLNYFDQ